MTLFGRPISILGVAGDQQAAAIGQGCFLLVHTGTEPVFRMLTAVAWRMDGKLAYALEGSILAAETAVQWLRDDSGVIRHAGVTAALAEQAAADSAV